MNAGAKAMSALECSCSELVAKLSAEGLTVSLMAISRWQTGKRKPAPDARKAIAKALKIPAASWDSDVKPRAGQLGPGQDVELVDDHTVAHVPTRPVAPPAPEDPTAAELAHDLLTRIQIYREQSEMTTLGVQARKALAEMEGKAIERYAKLTGQAATERDVLRSPHFTKVLDEMFAVLEKHPEALRALRAALAASEAA